MNLKKIFKYIPAFSFSVLFFYLIVILLWQINVIPSPDEVFGFLENFYVRAGLLGLFVAALLEGLCYIGHYFPGMTIIFISIIISNENFSEIVLIIAVVTLALTISSFLNYWGGVFFSRFSKGASRGKEKEIGKGFFLAALHPAFLSLYFFHSGLKRKNFWNFAFVPLIVFPYGIVIAYILYSFSKAAKSVFLNEFFFLAIFAAWFLFDFAMKNKRYWWKRRE